MLREELKLQVGEEMEVEKEDGKEEEKYEEVETGLKGVEEKSCGV